MDHKKQVDDFIRTLLESEDNSEKIEKKDLSEPSPPAFTKLTEQRHRQRKYLFWFAIGSSSLSLLTLLGLVIVNSYLQYQYFGLFEGFFKGNELQILSVSVFGQLIGVVIVIANSLWNEAPLMKMHEIMYGSKHPQSSVSPSASISKDS